MEKSTTSVFKPKDQLDSALGSVIGAFAGDAMGAYLEFCSFEINHKSVTKAMTFPGGGAFKVAPGQITDDSELALSMAHGLLEVI